MESNCLHACPRIVKQVAKQVVKRVVGYPGLRFASDAIVADLYDTRFC
jgi:hypothetical protein